MLHSITHALGIGQPVDPFPPRRPGHRYLLGDHVTLSPWRTRFRFGYVLSVAGPYRHTAVGVVGPDWEGGNWLGGMGWKRHGPIAICRWRRRGSWRSNRHFARVMAKPTITTEALAAHQSLTDDLDRWAGVVHELVVERIEELQAVHPEDHPGGESARQYAERVLAKGQFPMPENELDRRGYEHVEVSYSTVVYSGPYSEWSEDGEDFALRIARISVPSWVITDLDGPNRYRAETTAMVAAATAQRNAERVHLDELIKRMLDDVPRED